MNLVDGVHPNQFLGERLSLLVEGHPVRLQSVSVGHDRRLLAAQVDRLPVDFRYPLVEVVPGDIQAFQTVCQLRLAFRRDAPAV